MIRKKLVSLILAAAVSAVSGFEMMAQEGMGFKSEAFSQSYNDDADSTGRDSTDVMFSFRQYFRAMRHKEEGKIGTMFAGSTIVIGGQQIYNRDYWKLPVIYGGLAATAGLGSYYIHKDGKKDLGKYLLAGAGAIYWGSLMDGVVSYDTKGEHSAGRATLYSLLVPGLGQIYNKEYWKLPLYYSGLMVSASLLIENSANYHRFKRIHNEITDENSTYSGHYTESSALYMRNTYRRYRDYSVVALVGVYVLQIIDANVFSYMLDFDIDDEIAVDVSPTIITPQSQFAMGRPVDNAYGISIGIKF